MRHASIGSVLAALFALSCATGQSAARRADANDQMRLTMTVWRDCMFAAADTLAAGSGTASEVASGAQGLCGREYAEFRRATSDFFAVGVSESYELEARTQADQRVDQIKSDMREVIIARVLKRRSKSTP